MHKEGTKADYVLAALPEDVFPMMSDWISQQPEGPISYTLLKAELLCRIVATPEECAEMLLALVKQPLGDQKPLAVLQDMISSPMEKIQNE